MPSFAPKVSSNTTEAVMSKAVRERLFHCFVVAEQSTFTTAKCCELRSLWVIPHSGFSQDEAEKEEEKLFHHLFRE